MLSIHCCICCICLYVIDIIDSVYCTLLGPHYTNPADYVVNRVQENSEFFIEKWKQNQHNYIDLDFNNYQPLYPHTKQNSSFWTQTKEVLRREFQILARDPRPSKIRLVQTLAFAGLTGILYYQLPYDPEGLRNRFGAVFFLTVNSSMTGLISTVWLYLSIFFYVV